MGSQLQQDHSDFFFHRSGKFQFLWEILPIGKILGEIAKYFYRLIIHMIKSHKFTTFDFYRCRCRTADSDQWEGCFKYRGKHE